MDITYRVDFNDDELNGLFQKYYANLYYFVNENVLDMGCYHNSFLKWCKYRKYLKEQLVKKNVIKEAEDIDDTKLYDNTFDRRRNKENITNPIYFNGLQYINVDIIKRIIKDNMASKDPIIKFISNLTGTYEYKDSIVEIKPTTTQILEVPRYLYNKYTDEELSKVPKELHFEYKILNVDGLIQANFDTYNIHNCLPALFCIYKKPKITLKTIQHFKGISFIKDVMDFKIDFSYKSPFLDHFINDTQYKGTLLINLFIANEYEDIDKITKFLEKKDECNIVLEKGSNIIYSNLDKTINEYYKNK